MPLDLSHKIHPEHLEVHVSGERSRGTELAEAIALWSKVFSISNRENKLNILANNRTRGRFPVKAQIDLAFKIQEMGCTFGHKIALIAYSNEFLKNAQLIVRFMKGKGYTVQLFTNKDKAKRWLLRKKNKARFLDLFDSFK